MGRPRLNKKCSKEGCDRKHYGKGYCEKHYIQEFRREHKKEYYKRNKEKIISQSKQYNEKNREKRRRLSKEWVRRNKDRRREYNKQYHQKNKAKLNDYNKQYYEENKERFKEYHKNNPEISLKNTKKSLTRLCIELNKDNIKDWTVPTIKYALQNWSQSVKKRDKMCQICRSIKDLHAHHIFYKRFYPKLCLNLNNGITLCHSCHMEIHRLN